MGILEGKVAIITGAGSGMGRAMAMRFGKEGAKVVALDYAEGTADATAAAVRDAGGEAIGLKSDVSNAVDLDAAVAAAVDTFGGIDILCNNAGILDWNGLETADWDYWDRVQLINAKAQAMLTQKVVPHMEKRGGGSVVNTASIAASLGGQGGLSYTVSKGGVVAGSRHNAIELGPKNIRVNVILPGAVATGMTTGISDNKDMVAGFPIPRWGTSEEIANAALFLASDEASYITGVALPVDGGVTAQ